MTLVFAKCCHAAFGLTFVTPYIYYCSVTSKVPKGNEIVNEPYRSLSGRKFKRKGQLENANGPKRENKVKGVLDRCADSIKARYAAQIQLATEKKNAGGRVQGRPWSAKKAVRGKATKPAPQSKDKKKTTASMIPAKKPSRKTTGRSSKETKDAHKR